MVTLQLVFTFSIVCVFTFSSVVKQAVQSSLWMCISSYIIFLVVSLCLILCRSFSRLYPWNLVGLVSCADRPVAETLCAYFLAAPNSFLSAQRPNPRLSTPTSASAPHCQQEQPQDSFPLRQSTDFTLSHRKILPQEH